MRDLTYRLVSWLSAGLLLLVVAAQPALSEDGAEATSYHWFFTRSKHINQLLQAGDIRKASAVWCKEAAYFKESRKTADRKCTEDLADALENLLEQQARQTEAALLEVKWPQKREQWAATKQILGEASKFVQDVGSHQVLVHLDRVERITQGAARALQALLGRITADAPRQLLAHKGASGFSFFTEYPVEMNEAEFLSINKPLWLEALAGYTCEEIETFAASYGKYLAESDLESLGEIYFGKTIGTGEVRKATLSETLAALRRTQEAGFVVAPLKDGSIRVIEIESLSGKKDSGVEFPVNVTNDVPIIAATDSVGDADLDAVFSGPETASAPILILLDPATARVERKVQPPKTVRSKFQTGTSTVPNPAYAKKLLRLRQIERVIGSMEQNARTHQLTCAGFNCLAAAIVDNKLIGDAISVYENATADLNSTPMTLEKPTFTPYEFRRTVIDVTKFGTINYYVIDRVARTYVKGSFPAEERGGFSVCYGVNHEDPDRRSHMAGTHTEEEIEKYEQSPVRVLLSKILDGLREQKAGLLPTIASLRNDILSSRNKNKDLAAAKKKMHAAVVQEDTRFDSVVVVLSAGSHLGSGFFVKDDVVLTNYHVVKESKFAEMRLRNGSETFGKVIAQDARLDLALIRVQARGVPVRIYKEQTLTLGDQVEVIGHPAGLEFSITRGVMSGIRELPSRYLPGGRKVRFIQTDAAINPGNSGGPVYCKDRVVGVSTWKVAAMEIAGLNFAVHYAEVLDFLEVNGITPPG